WTQEREKIKKFAEDHPKTTGAVVVLGLGVAGFYGWYAAEHDQKVSGTINWGFGAIDFDYDFETGELGFSITFEINF
ncbi:MAG: hypothetical protein IAF38_20265, partial [Bacteroidia bacterium]|nr:hypothetical protein [Bacteroidia bacterium]